MDDVFQILIYAIIIISFISSFFRKKKVPPKDVPGDAQVRQGPVDRPEIKTEATSQSKSGEVEFDLFKEFENFFNVTETKTKPQQTRQLFPVQENIISGEDYIPVPEKSFHEQTASEHSYTDEWTRKKNEIEQKKKTISDKIEKEATQFEKYLKKEVKSGDDLLSSIKQKLQQPASLREYIIVSEIFGRPKALSKWNRKSIS